jgi:DNA-binding transcriptional LysR family regulator
VAEYTLRQLEYFVAVAESGSVTGAAARVHLSQSAMSTALADLERAMDVQLLPRHHARGVTLEAHEFGQELTGAIAIGCFGVLAPYVVPELLATCAERYPALRLDTYEVDLDALAQGVISGRFELGLGYRLAPDPRLVVSRVFTLSPYVLVPAGHKLAGRSKVTLAQLAGEPLALLDLPQSREYFLGMFAAAGVEPNIRYHSSSVETLRALVGRGLAYTLLNLKPAVSISLDGHQVVSLALADGGMPLEVVLVTPVGSRPTRRAVAVAALSTEVLRRRGREPQDAKTARTSGKSILMHD